MLLQPDAQPGSASAPGQQAKEETALLKERITALASRDLPQRKELYELLEIVTAIAGDIEAAGDDLVNGLSRYKKERHTFQGGGYLGDLIRAVIHFINRWGRTEDRHGDLKQKQQQLIDKSKHLLGTPLPPPGGNGPGSAMATTPPPGDGVPEPIDISTNGSQPQQPAEPTDPQLQPPQQPLPQPQPQDQTKGADGHG